MKMNKKQVWIFGGILGFAVVLTVGILAGISMAEKNSRVEPPVIEYKIQDEVSPSEVPEEKEYEVIETEKVEIEQDEAIVYADDPSHLFYDSDAQSGYLKHCIFLGDSRTVAAKDNSYLNDADALCQVGINHLAFMNNTFLMYSGEEIQMDTFLKRSSAEVVYISLGVNGINTIDDDSYKKGFNRLVDRVKELCPGSAVVIEAIWPVEDDGAYSYAVHNEEIDKYNTFLHELALEKDCYYLNVDSVLKDPDGTMIDKYDGGDGLHYSKSSYEVIFDYIIHHPVPGIDTTGEYVVNYIPPLRKDNARPEDGFAATSEYDDDADTGDTETSKDNGGDGNSEEASAPEQYEEVTLSTILSGGIPSGNLEDGTQLYLYNGIIYTEYGGVYLNINTGQFGPGFEYIAEE